VDDLASTPDHLNQQTDPMSTRNSSDQPKASPDWGYSRGWRVFIVGILRPLLRLLMRYEWQGRENFPKAGGVILAPNHLSYADWPAIALFSDAYGHRFPVFMIKSAVFELKLIGPLLYKVGELPVYRGRGDAGLVLRQAEQALRKGACVIVYPEGTASRDPDLWPMVGKTGAARLALTTGAPVIPIAHWGAQEILPYGTKQPHLWPRKTVRMVAGPPVDLSAYAGQRLSASLLRAATADIMADITALLAKIRQETPPAVPYDPDAGDQLSPARTDGSAPAPPGASGPAEAAPAKAVPAKAEPSEAGAEEPRGAGPA
jgi:1-acyl-sn-glycerol-3-phosphate acyltransferase